VAVGNRAIAQCRYEGEQTIGRLTLLTMDTTLSPPTGQLLDGRYQVESRLAHGGMATVYLGRDTRLDRIVALKIAHPELARDREFVRRFMTEARAVAQLSSPNVVAVYDQGSAGDVLYIAMEYVAGPTLREVLNARHSLSVQESLDVIEGVLSGLAAAHRAGIIHRDVKPENVLLGTGGAVKVADFGLARAAAAATHTKTGMIIGTAAYLAPEQVSSSASDARTDVYAAGVMLFEMLTGVQPHTGESPLAVAYKHVNEVVPSPSSLVPGLPPALDALVALATSRDPDLRPADAGQFLHAITEVRQGGSPSLARRGQHAVPGGSLAIDSGRATGSAQAFDDSLADTDLGPAARDPLTPVTGGGSGAAGRNGHRSGELSTPGARHALGRGGPVASTGDGDGQANHTLVVSAGTIVPGFGDPEEDRRGRRLRGYRPEQPSGYPSDQEPPLQRLLFSRRLIYALGGLAVVLITVLLVWWLTAGQYTRVPQVINWSSGLARTELTGLGFKVHDGPGHHSNVPRGHIIATSPKAGTKIKNGSTITFTLSLGPVKVKVPAIAAGTVISTDPVAGTLWPKNKPVAITVSAGPPLPNFVGQQVSAAQSTAAAGGYQINPVQEAKGSEPANTVVRQSPAAGTPIQPNEVVQVYFSPGPPQSNVPNVQGMSEQDATQALQQAGFHVAVNKVGPGHIVVSFSPQGSQPAGSTITINVGFSFF
jgi:beta-lactam-binding protein with PASTA domain/predicted Ser/Thr protein kinase